MMKIDDCFYECAEHPNADIKHNYDSSIFTCGSLIGKPLEHNHKYFCAKCGKELLPIEVKNEKH